LLFKAGWGQGMMDWAITVFSLLLRCGGEASLAKHLTCCVKERKVVNRLKQAEITGFLSVVGINSVQFCLRKIATVPPGHRTEWI
jgi:hypothetical protein